MVVTASNKSILVKWRWNTSTQRFLQVVRNTLYLGVKLQVRQQKKRKLCRRTKGLVHPSLKQYARRVVEASVGA